MLRLVIRPCACAAIAALLATGANATPQIYRCEIAGVPTYEDRPCGQKSARYEPEASGVSTYTPTPSQPRSAAPTPRKRAARRASNAEAQSKRAEECSRIGAALREIRSKMRAGYNVREGERLRARKAQLDERRRAHKCG